uniref:ZP domain-containing protein n=1 Tax=Romanomermis culicivorax TaxID=13658 RepID=A0A915J5B3_ROMCU
MGKASHYTGRCSSLPAIIDNEVIGNPQIECGDENIKFGVKTKNAFTGNIYVKGQFNEMNCSTNSSSVLDQQITVTESSSATVDSCYCPPCPSIGRDPFEEKKKYLIRKSRTIDSHAIDLNVKIGSCNMKRERLLNPSRISLSFNAVVSFHHLFMTAADRAYQITCFYQESDQTVTSVLDVDFNIADESLDTLMNKMPMPTCTYSIRRDGVDGQEVKFAKVGDKVHHMWICESQAPSVFGILVKKCTVNNGKGDDIEIVDDAGCSTDKSILNEITYDESKLKATVETTVFKFADQSTLDFQCGIKLCTKFDNGCDYVTPPRCETRKKRSTEILNNYSVIDDANKQILSPPGWISTNKYDFGWSLHAGKINVLELDDQTIDAKEIELLNSEGSYATIDKDHKNAASATDVSQYCLSLFSFGIFISLCTFVLTMSCIATSFIYISRYSHSDLIK